MVGGPEGGHLPAEVRGEEARVEGTDRDEPKPAPEGEGGVRFTAFRVENGVPTKAQYEALCRWLGIEPDYEDVVEDEPEE